MEIFRMWHKFLSDVMASSDQLAETTGYCLQAPNQLRTPAPTIYKPQLFKHQLSAVITNIDYRGSIKVVV